MYQGGVLDLPPLLHEADGVEEPEGGEEEEEEKADEGSEEVDTGEGGAGLAVEDSPGAHGKDEQLEGEGDEEAVTLDLALELGVPQTHPLHPGEGEVVVVGEGGGWEDNWVGKGGGGRRYLGRRTMMMGERKARTDRRATRNWPRYRWQYHRHPTSCRSVMVILGKLW